MNLNLGIIHKKTSAIKLFAYLAGILILFIFFIKPSIADIKKLHNNILNEKIKIQKNIDREKNMNKLSEEVKKIEPRMKKFSEIFINKNRELEFITQLEAIAQKNNVTQNINLQTTENKNTKNSYSEIPLTINIVGYSDNVLNYLNNLETIKYYINIYNLSLTERNQNQKTSFEDDQGTSKKIVSLNIKALSYWK